MFEVVWEFAEEFLKGEYEANSVLLRLSYKVFIFGEADWEVTFTRLENT